MPGSVEQLAGERGARAPNAKGHSGMVPRPAAGGTDRGRYLILHGWQNRRPPKHWQYRLAGHLTALGHEVHYPQLPSPDRPVVKEWLAAIEEQLAQTVPGELTVICHSLACLAWMHLSDQGSGHLPVRRLLFVAPPSPDVIAGIPELAGFQMPPSTHLAVASSVLTPPRLACAEDDAYCPERADRVYPGVFDVDVVENARHFDIPARYGEWESVLRWCGEPEIRLTPAAATVPAG
jgi:predicted alpha/beta hydrolase family esterase